MSEQKQEELQVKQLALDAALRLLETKQFIGADKFQTFDTMINVTVANAKKFEEYLKS
ncbi:MAG: hypothetical protein FWB73_00025 [Treponema sp.]|nr:hypothetical protein [Treponema sp.]